MSPGSTTGCASASSKPVSVSNSASPSSDSSCGAGVADFFGCGAAAGCVGFDGVFGVSTGAARSAMTTSRSRVFLMRRAYISAASLLLRATPAFACAPDAIGMNDEMNIVAIVSKMPSSRMNCSRLFVSVTVNPSRPARFSAGCCVSDGMYAVIASRSDSAPRVSGMRPGVVSVTLGAGVSGGTGSSFSNAAGMFTAQSITSETKLP